VPTFGGCLDASPHTLFEVLFLLEIILVVFLRVCLVTDIAILTSSFHSDGKLPFQIGFFGGLSVFSPPAVNSFSSLWTAEILLE